jgi:hypothetical protein
MRTAADVSPDSAETSASDLVSLTRSLPRDLARIVEAWDELPLFIRTSILALVDASSTGR